MRDWCFPLKWVFSLHDLVSLLRANQSFLIWGSDHIGVYRGVLPRCKDLELFLWFRLFCFLCFTPSVGLLCCRLQLHRFDSPVLSFPSEQFPFCLCWHSPAIGQVFLRKRYFAKPRTVDIYKLIAWRRDRLIFNWFVIRSQPIWNSPAQVVFKLF